MGETLIVAALSALSDLTETALGGQTWRIYHREWLNFDNSYVQNLCTYSAITADALLCWD
jgi:hypothetical protein